MSKQPYDFPGFGALPPVPQMREQRGLFSTGPTGNPLSSRPGTREENLYCLAEMASTEAQHMAGSSLDTSSRSGIRYFDNFFDTKPLSHSTTGFPLSSYPPPSFSHSSFPPPALAMPPLAPPPPVVPPGPVLPMCQWPLPSTAGSQADGIMLSLPPENQWLWEQFFSADTEMIITKAGRRMFPAVMICVEGLELDTKYNMVLEMRCLDRCRYKYANSKWIKTSKAGMEFSTGIPEVPSWTHLDGPKSGANWMKDPISFKKAKLTNDPQTTKGHIIVQSMHKYVPCIKIMKETPAGSGIFKSVHEETLCLCQFVSVTAYQSNTITQMKIDYNPFAKAFREPVVESKGLGGVRPPMTSYSMTTPSYSMASSHPYNWMRFLPYGTGYLLSPPYSSQVSNYSHFPYQFPSLMPETPLASASMPQDCCPLPPFQYMQQWRPSGVEAAAAAAATAAVSIPRSSCSSMMSPGWHQGQSSLSQSTTIGNPFKKVRIHPPQEDPEDTSESDEQLSGKQEET